ncbi:hypothetical protein [Actinomadura coerulea]|uniref:hypothetical protein n=1 Tax=Actinomadura coerulea TaxID=46159 RepID=UPI00343BAB14
MTAEWLTHVGGVGRALPHVSLRILDGDRNEVPVGRVGTVYFKNGEPGPSCDHPSRDDRFHSAKADWNE